MKKTSSSSTVASDHFSSDNNAMKCRTRAVFPVGGGDVVMPVVHSTIKEVPMRATFLRIGAMAAMTAFLLLVAGSKPAFGAKTFTGPGNFSDSSKWNGNSVPAAGDDLKISGTCTFDNAANNLAYGALDVGSGAAGTLQWPVGGTNTLNVSSISSSTAGSAIDMTNGGTLRITNSWSTTNQTFTAGTGTIHWNNTAANSTLPAGIATYNNLMIDVTGRTTSLGVTISLNGNLTILAGTLDVSTSNFGINLKGDWTHNGTGFTARSGTVTFNGTTQSLAGSTATTFSTLTIANGATVTGTTAPTISTFNINGGGKYIHTTATGIPGTTRSFAATSTYEVQNSAMSFSNLSFGNVTINYSGIGSLNTSGLLQTIQGSLRIQNTGTGQFRLGSSTSNTHNISGDVIVDAGTFVFSNGTGTPTVNVTGNVQLNGGTLQPATGAGVPVFNVAGNWTNNGGAFTPGSGTVTFNSTTAGQNINGSASSQSFNNVTVSKSGQTLTIGGSAASVTVAGTLNISAGTFDQGSTSALSTSTGGTISVTSGATFKNFGTGNLTLGSGGVSNAGTININGAGGSCGDADILIRSSSAGTQRTWSGAGTFTITDADVQDQRTPVAPPPVAIFVTSGLNSGNNTGWVFLGCTSGTYVWTGTVSTDWQVAANWSPMRTALATADVLVFDGTGTPAPTVTNVPTQTIAALRLVNTANPVTLSALAAPQTLTLSGGTGTDLSIASGSLLTLAGSNALTIALTAGGTQPQGTVSGQIIMQGAGHRLTGANASEITFNSGAFFTTSTGFTGNAFGTGTAGSVVFASGSVYFHNAGDSPFGTAGGSAVCVFQTGSTAKWFTSSGFQASGRTYANLEIGDGTTATGVSDTGTGDFQFDDLTIKSTGSANSSLTYNGSSTATITIKGNISSTGVGSGTFPDVLLTSGSGGFIIDKSGGTITFSTTGNARSISLDGNGSVTSTTTLALSRILQLGSINVNTKTLTVDGSITGGSTGYVIGSLKKTSVPTGAFTFPVGTVNGYSPIDTNVTAGTGSLKVAATQSVHGSVNAATSLKRYWTLTASGTSLDFESDLTFHYLDPTDIAGTEANYRLIRIDGGTAVSFPNNCASPTDEQACVNTGTNQATITGVTGFSDWTLGENIAPTAVRLTGFTATTRDDGVKLEWRSGFEADNLGYVLYRYQDGQRTRVTPSLIAGSSLIRKQGSELASGFSYGWFDPQGAVGTQYELQAIDLHGDVQTFSPRYVAKSGSHGDPKKGRATTLTEISAAGAGDSAQRGWAYGADNALATAPASTQSLATQQSIAAQPAVKIRVNQTGWYRVTQPQLLANGLSASADARKLQLYVDGVEVPIRLSTNQSTLAAGDTLEFYGVGLDALTTDTHTYYLISGTRNGLRIPTNADKGSGKTKNDVLSPDFLYTVESKERNDYSPGLLNGDKGNIFGQFVESIPVDQTVTLQNINSNSNAAAQLEVVLQGYTEVAHQVQVQFNGSYVGTIYFSGTTNKSSTLPVSTALLREGANTVTLVATGGDIDFSGIDALRITYSHTYRADNDRLFFSVGNRSAQVNGFSSAAIRVIDITNPNAVQELAPKITNVGGSYGFTVQSSSTTQNLLAFLDNLSAQPAAIVRNQPSTWNANTNAADMVIVTHGDFRTGADTLAAARRAQGMKVSVVDVEDVYDEFSYGAHTPQAVKDFLSFSNSQWATKPKYALLFGDSSWDPRNYLGQGYNDYVPTKLIDTSELETASDDWVADFNNDGIPEIAVGRLPARTASDAVTMVSKILNYDQERASGAPLRGALLVSDGGFENQTAEVASYLAALTTVQSLNRSAIGNDNAMQTQIVNAIDQGPTIVNYFGHGSVTVWTGAGLLNENNGGTLTNGNRQSLFVMMTCLNGYADDAFIDSLAEVVLKNPQGGAFAVWASSGITVPVGQAQMNTQLYQSLLGNQPMTLGDAVRQAKMATTDLDVRRTWILFGDPAMRLK